MYVCMFKILNDLRLETDNLKPNPDKKKAHNNRYMAKHPLDRLNNAYIEIIKPL